MWTAVKRPRWHRACGSVHPVTLPCQRWAAPLTRPSLISTRPVNTQNHQRNQTTHQPNHNIPTYTHSHTQSHKVTDTQSHIHTQTHRHTRTHYTHTRTLHTHTHTHIHKHTTTQAHYTHTHTLSVKSHLFVGARFEPQGQQHCLCVLPAPHARVEGGIAGLQGAIPGTRVHDRKKKQRRGRRNNHK